MLNNNSDKREFLSIVEPSFCGGTHTGSCGDRKTLIPATITVIPIELPFGSRLDPEPDVTTDAATVLVAKIRLPTGKTVVRRFPHGALLVQVFLFIQQELGVDDDQAMRLQLARRIEPRTWSVPDASSLNTLAEVGLGVKAEALIATVLP